MTTSAFQDQAHNKLTKRQMKITSIILMRAFENSSKILCHIIHQWLTVGQPTLTYCLDLHLSRKKSKSSILKACQSVARTFLASARATDAGQNCCSLCTVFSAHGQTAPSISIVLAQVFPFESKVKCFLRKYRWLLCASSVHSHQLPNTLGNDSSVEATTFVS